MPASRRFKGGRAVSPTWVMMPAASPQPIALSQESLTVWYFPVIRILHLNSTVRHGPALFLAEIRHCPRPAACMKPVRFCKKSKKVAWDFGCFRVGRIPSDARRSDPHQLLRGCLPPQRAAFRWARAIYARRNAPSQIQGRRILSRVKDTESADGAMFTAKKATPD
jgi:hypothetical protein